MRMLLLLALHGHAAVRMAAGYPTRPLFAGSILTMSQHSVGMRWLGGHCLAATRRHGSQILLSAQEPARPVSRDSFSPSIAGIDRRALMSATFAAGFALFSDVTSAAERGVQWRVDIPETFTLSRSLSSIVRVRVETVLAAEGPSGLQVKLLLVPFGMQAAGSFTSDEQLLLAKAFLDAGVTADPEQVATTMLTSAARSPSVVRIEQTTSPLVVSDSAGRSYVQYAYEAARCSDEIYEGECLGTTTTRATIARVTVSAISQYRTNTERQRMNELGQVRNVDVLWVITASYPTQANADQTVAATAQSVLNSFTVPFQ